MCFNSCGIPHKVVNCIKFSSPVVHLELLEVSNKLFLKTGGMQLTHTKSHFQLISCVNYSVSCKINYSTVAQSQGLTLMDFLILDINTEIKISK